MKNTIQESTNAGKRKKPLIMKNNLDAYLQFDFKPTNGAVIAPLVFSKPKRVITTSEFEGIAHCLREIEEANQAGFYVAGYFSYEIVYALQHMPYPQFTHKMPLLWFGVFDGVRNETIPQKAPFQIGEWQMQASKVDYEKKFNKIMDAIHIGETKQINYTVPFQAKFTGDTYTYYEQLKNAQSAHFSAYLSLGNFDILSASPELFFQMDDGNLTVRPMKGTIHRGKTYEEDVQLRNWLISSKKNKLENQLIIEHMREEMADIVHKESMHMIDPYRVEKYPTVYQMTSGLTGKVLPDLSVMDVLQSLFPCGSIAGVPKKASLDIIRSLEDRPREVYCGAIGYMTPDMEAVFNVPIRTVWVDHQTETAHYGAGGAITKNSSCDEEYQEVLTKTNVLTWKETVFDLLETLGLYDGEYIVLEEHLERLKKSATYFDIPIEMGRVQKKLNAIRQEHPTGNWRVRLTVNNHGEKLACFPLPATGAQVIRLAKQAIDKENLYLYHKTTHREFYETYKQNACDVFDVLLWNEAGEITECTIGNIVVKLNGEFYTPPVSCGLLPGTFRAHLLRVGMIKERVILKDVLEQCTGIWLINSVRKWVEVSII